MNKRHVSQIQEGFSEAKQTDPVTEEFSSVSKGIRPRA